MPDPYLTTEQASKLLGFSEQSILRWARRGDLPSYQVAGQRRFRASELEAWMQERKSGSVATVHELRSVGG